MSWIQVFQFRCFHQQQSFSKPSAPGHLDLTDFPEWVGMNSEKTTRIRSRFCPKNHWILLYGGVWPCIAWFWDLQTTSFEIAWFLGYWASEIQTKSLPTWDLVQKNPVVNHEIPSWGTKIYTPLRVAGKMMFLFHRVGYVVFFGSGKIS